MVNLNSTVVFLGIAYIQQSVGKNLGFLIPFTSVLLALIAIHMMRNKLTYKPKKGNVAYIKTERREYRYSDALVYTAYIPHRLGRNHTK